MSADFYAGIVLPDGITVVTLGPDGSPSLGRLADIAGLRPLGREVSLGTPFAVTLEAQLMESSPRIGKIVLTRGPRNARICPD